jgi:uncharacterized protein (DUF736 family)
MMAYEQKDMSGSLFKNDRKETDSHPDYKGSALINGVDHWLDAWINTSNAGVKYMSLKLKPKNGAVSTQHTGAANSATTGQHYTATIGGAPDLDDDFVAF